MLSRIKDWTQSGLIYAIKGVSFFERVSGYTLAIIIIVLLLLICTSVIARYFGKPILLDFDIVTLIVPALAFLGVAYCQQFRGHLRIEFIIERLKGRSYHFVESLLLALSICIFLLLAVYTFRDAINAYQAGYVTPATFLPTWYTRFLIAFGCILMCFRLVIQLTQNLIQLANGIERKDLNRSRMEG